MRPRQLLAITVAMGILNLTCFLSPKRAPYFAATLWAEILVALVGYLILWFFWKGKNWARISVLLASVLSVINLIELLHPYGNVIVYDSIVIAWALAGFFLLYWLNLADVREWFTKGKTAFRLLNLYSRSTHECFVAEMFLNDAGTEYTICFRPINANWNSPNRLDCRYLYLANNEVETLNETKALTVSLTERIDSELRLLGKSV
jgi:hypothetical protein